MDGTLILRPAGPFAMPARRPPTPAWHRGRAAVRRRSPDQPPVRLPPERLPFLDGLRGAAALYVLAHHCWFELFPDAMNHPPAGVTARLAAPLAFGHWAVGLFIVLSGFCLYRPVAADGGRALAGGAADFYRRRARRILPPYFAALAVSLALIYAAVGTGNGCHWDVALAPGHAGVSRRGLLAAVFLVGDAIGSYQVNHAFWSVQVECKIYLLFPLLAWAARRAGPWAMAVTTGVLAFAAAVVGHRLQTTHGWTLDGLSVQFVGLFAAGMLAAHVAARPPRLPGWAGPLTTAVAAAGVATATWHLGVIRAMHVGQALDAGVAVAAAAGVVWLARNPRSWPTRTLACRPLVWVGTLSFSVYLLHAPLVQVAYRYAVHPMHLPMAVQLPALVAAAAVLTLAAAVPFHLACERPFAGRRGPRAVPAA